MTNSVGAQLGSATCVRSFQDDKLCVGATWERNLCEILSGLETGWGRNLGAQLV